MKSFLELRHAPKPSSSETPLLNSRITDLTLQIRDRRDKRLSWDEVRETYEHFDELWDEIAFEERQ